MDISQTSFSPQIPPNTLALILYYIYLLFSGVCTCLHKSELMGISSQLPHQVPISTEPSCQLHVSIILICITLVFIKYLLKCECPLVWIPREAMKATLSL